METYFSENLETPLFPILAEKYFGLGKYNLAKKVCDIGLSIHPDSSQGNYILAKLELVEENYSNAEILLKKVIKHNPIHLLAMHLLLELQKELKRSKRVINKTVMQIAAINPQDETYVHWQNSLQDKGRSKKNSTETPKAEKKSETEPKIKTEKTIEKEKFTINKHLASVTLAQVYKKQGYFDQALQVLQLVKGKDTKNSEIDKEIKEVQNLLNESSNNE